MGFITQREQHHRIEHTTQIVPLTIGVGFGVDVQLPNGVELREVEISVFHPAYIGTSVTEESWKTDLKYQDSNLNFFLFEFPFEMVAGDWAIQASYQGDQKYGTKPIYNALNTHLLLLGCSDGVQIHHRRRPPNSGHAAYQTSKGTNRDIQYPSTLRNRRCPAQQLNGNKNGHKTTNP
ncbi:hypothetical protein GQR58_029129 [Nymphon striatum]|nr:hypothetical protein GQR58_029129 [Nymphon striatum]